MIDSANRDIVHHLLLHECNPTAKYDDNNLPHGLCDDILDEIQPCSANVASGWAVGGEEVSVEHCDISRSKAWTNSCFSRSWSSPRSLDILWEVT